MGKDVKKGKVITRRWNEVFVRENFRKVQAIEKFVWYVLRLSYMTFVLFL